MSVVSLSIVQIVPLIDWIDSRQYSSRDISFFYCIGLSFQDNLFLNLEVDYLDHIISFYPFLFRRIS